MFNWIYHNAYILALALSGLSSVVLLVIRHKQYRLPAWKAALLGLVFAAFAFLGAKLHFMLENPGDTGGMLLYGGYLMVVIAIPLISRFFSLGKTESLDACTPCGAAMVGFVRFGCYLAGCCGGCYTTVGGRVFQWPTQLMECLWDFVVLGILLQMEQKEHKTGSLYAWFFILYCPARFLLEFLRDTPKDWLGLSHGHWYSLIGLAFGLLALFYANYPTEVKYGTKKKHK